MGVNITHLLQQFIYVTLLFTLLYHVHVINYYVLLSMSQSKSNAFTHVSYAMNVNPVLYNVMNYLAIIFSLLRCDYESLSIKYEFANHFYCSDRFIFVRYGFASLDL